MKWLALALLAGLACGPAWGQGMFEGRAIVTGMDGRGRADALRAALMEVLARASGDPGVAQDPDARAIDPAPMLRAFAYLDRMSDLPRQDEQGSRDRPYDLVAQFDPRAVDAALRGLGRSVWPDAARPVVAATVRVRPRVGEPFTLHADTDVDERHRAALLAAGARYGLVLRLDPEAGPLAAWGPAPALSGVLIWEEGAGWRADWAFDGGVLGGVSGGSPRAWSVSGVGFDEAYRAGVGGAARALSGQGR